MLTRSSRTNLTAWTAYSLLLALLVVLCVRYLDAPLAYFVKNHFYANEGWSRLTSNLPDLLLLVVLFTTLASLVFYRVHSGRGYHDAVTQLARLVAWAGPTAYLAKSVTKFVFGRVNTRVWLEEPRLNGFHWFQKRQGCEGFPSGHMVVIVTLLAALWRHYPKWRPCCLVLGLLLGVALIATDYHFLSDVLAGAFLGVLVEAAVYGLLARTAQPPADQAR